MSGHLLPNDAMSIIIGVPFNKDQLRALTHLGRAGENVRYVACLIAGRHDDRDQDVIGCCRGTWLRSRNGEAGQCKKVERP